MCRTLPSATKEVAGLHRRPSLLTISRDVPAVICGGKGAQRTSCFRHELKGQSETRCNLQLRLLAKSARCSLVDECYWWECRHRLAVDSWLEVNHAMLQGACNGAMTIHLSPAWLRQSVSGRSAFAEAQLVAQNLCTAYCMNKGDILPVRRAVGS